MGFFEKKKPLDKLDEGDLLGLVKKQERVFKRNDRELDRLEGKRKLLLEQAKGASPTQLGLLREKYKVVRSDREIIANEYKKSLAIYRITSTVHQMVRAGKRKERAVDIVKELSSKTKLNPDKIRQILDSGGIDDDVALSEWNELSEELNQQGIDMAERSDETYDPEFDQIVTTLKSSPNANLEEIIKETDKNLAAKSKEATSLEG